MKYLHNAKALACLILLTGITSAYAASSAPSNKTSSGDSLHLGFLNPPNSARPRVWWHWMNGNVTKEGIKLDLEWMSRIGLGGYTVFEGSIDTPQVVQKRLVYMTPAWKDAFRYAISTSRNLGFETSIASSAGWSDTGGPWVPPAQAMKKMVWSSTRIAGGQPYSGRLPKPPDVAGSFQNFSIESDAGEKKAHPLPKFYADAAVVAYRIPTDEQKRSGPPPKVTSSGGQINVPALSDGDLNGVALSLPASQAGSAAWIQFEYAQPVAIQSVTLATLDDMISIFGFDNLTASSPVLEVSDDGRSFRHVIPIAPSSVPQRTVSFPLVTGRFFRVSFPTPASSKIAPLPHNHEISELILNRGARVNEFEKRAGFATVQNYYAIATPRVTSGSIVQANDVIDLTKKMKPDGSLNWNPPNGEWMVLRIGYSLTGHENGPAPPEATGLEVDKFNRNYVRNYLEHYLQTYSDTVGPSLIGKSGITLMLTDSAETGPQNWTDTMLAEFQKRRGYDAHVWLPALTGQIVDSPEATNRFLWDFRRTIAELLAQNHYGEVAKVLHEHHMGYYGEALEYHRPSLGDDMEMRRHTDIPMGAMWTFAPGEAPTPTYIVDLRGAASIAHIYGQNLVGAESMTSNGPAWGYSPDNLRRIADYEMALGVNRFMIHESTHQPLLDKVPGLTLGHYGLWFNRNQTWAEQAGPWVTYLARSSYMLQQGHFYADVAYFYGQEGPLTALFATQPQRDAPRGYGFDFINSDVILHQLSVHDGRLITPGGASYRMILLGGTSRRMTLPVLRRLLDLVQQGAIISGVKPIDSPSLSDDPKEFHKIVDELWGAGQLFPNSYRRVGRGRVYGSKSANQVLADLNIKPDFEYSHPEPDTKLMFVHRKLTNGDVYFMTNRHSRPESLDVTVRVAGKAPEIWHADTGLSEAISYRFVDGRTTFPLNLNADESVFVVFRKPTTIKTLTLPSRTETELARIDGAWDVAFQPRRGAPAEVKLQKLASWSDYPDCGIKYFSGTGTYTKTMDAPAAWFQPGRKLWLDLGDVEHLAEVTVNNKPMGIYWHAPYRVDVTQALKPGRNTLTIKVTNRWVNRLIGDYQPCSARKYTFTTQKFYSASSPLEASGLIGPVRVLLETRHTRQTH